MDNSGNASRAALEPGANRAAKTARLHTFPIASDAYPGVEVRFLHRQFRLMSNTTDFSIGDLFMFHDASDLSRHFFARVDNIFEGEVRCASVVDFGVVAC